MTRLPTYSKYILSFGLLPVIGTLALIHFFPVLPVLAGGLALSLLWTALSLAGRRAPNLFLLQGTLALLYCLAAGCLLPRPLSAVAVGLAIEFLLMVASLLHLTLHYLPRVAAAPQHPAKHDAYRLETTFIALLSVLHWGMLTAHPAWVGPTATAAPLLIYIGCIAVNSAGIRCAWRTCPMRHVVRIAPVCNGKIYLTRQQTGDWSSAVWDLPLESRYQGPVEQSDRHARRTLQTLLKKPRIHPRLILRQMVDNTLGTDKDIVSVYIYPMRQPNEFKTSNGRYFSFEELRTLSDRLGRLLPQELERLQMAAEIWHTYDHA